MLTTDAKARKATPIFSGVIRYFPDALAEVAEVSRIGNEQHNPGQPLHWAKEKSTDEYDALTRHLADVGTRDSDGTRHAAKVAWRALAGLQREIDKEREAAQKQAQYNAQVQNAQSADASRDMAGAAQGLGLIGGIFGKYGKYPEYP